MTNDQNILLALELHDDGLESNDNVAIRLSSSVSIVVLVLLTFQAQYKKRLSVGQVQEVIVMNHDQD